MSDLTPEERNIIRQHAKRRSQSVPQLEQQIADLKNSNAILFADVELLKPALDRANDVVDVLDGRNKELHEQLNKANERIVELAEQLNKVHSTTTDGFCHFCNRYHMEAKP